MKRLISLLIFSFVTSMAIAQTCNCDSTFSFLKKFMETNYAGFTDKLKEIGAKEYQSTSENYAKLAADPANTQSCLMVMQEYLRMFKDDHIQMRATFDAGITDTAFALTRLRRTVDEDKIASLKKSTGIEGIYTSNYDSSYTIAVIKEKTAIHDYVGIITDSKLSYWKKGVVKFEASIVNDSLLKGVLYMRNHMPKIEWFYIGKNYIGGDWTRWGQEKRKQTFKWVPIDAHTLPDNNFYLMVPSFSPSTAPLIDSVLNVHATALKQTNTLVIDIRNNGGGADFVFGPLLPLLYTHPVKNIGVDVLATEANINNWKPLLNMDDIPNDSKNAIRKMIEKMEAQKGKLVNIVEDETDSSYTAQAYPKKVVILMNENCASSAEQFLLFARQSSKVILAGTPSAGTLDYSNMREAPLPCMPYTLLYATTRSRRLDIGQGIDVNGIQPNVLLQPQQDWIQEAVKIAANFPKK